MKKWILALLLFVCLCTGGCGTESVRTDDYEYLIGVSLTNVMEPWLNNLAQVIGSRAETEKNVNLIFRDAAGSSEKQIQDIALAVGIDSPVYFTRIFKKATGFTPVEYRSLFYGKGKLN